MTAAATTVPRVSVAIAAYEAAGSIASAVQSALGQTLREIEVIVVDDASKDDTAGAARAAGAGDPRLTVVRLERNGGPSAARNAAFARARGDWIAVLDADDLMEPERLAALVAFAEAERADIVADWLKVVEDGAETGVIKPLDLPSPVGLAAYARDARRSGGAGYLKPMFRHAFLAQQGLVYDETLRIGEDWTFIADALALGARYVVLDRPLYRYAVHDGSISHRLSMAKLEAMIASADAFLERRAARLDDDARRALAERRSALADWLAFQTFIDALKARRIAPALRALASRPTSWPLLKDPIAAALLGRRGRRKLAG